MITRGLTKWGKDGIMGVLRDAVLSFVMLHVFYDIYMALKVVMDDYDELVLFLWTTDKVWVGKPLDSIYIYNSDKSGVYSI